MACCLLSILQGCNSAHAAHETLAMGSDLATQILGQTNGLWEINQVAASNQLPKWWKCQVCSRDRRKLRWFQSNFLGMMDTYMFFRFSPLFQNLFGPRDATSTAILHICRCFMTLDLQLHHCFRSRPLAVSLGGTQTYLSCIYTQIDNDISLLWIVWHRTNW